MRGERAKVLTANINSAVKIPSMKTPRVNDVSLDKVVLTLKLVGKMVLTRYDANIEPSIWAMKSNMALKTVKDLTSNIARVTCTHMSVNYSPKRYHVGSYSRIEKASADAIEHPDIHHQ